MVGGLDARRESGKSDSGGKSNFPFGDDFYPPASCVLFLHAIVRGAKKTQTQPAEHQTPKQSRVR